jgi:iron-sulfur cluster repair protein YtfE (RIC family)
VVQISQHMMVERQMSAPDTDQALVILPRIHKLYIVCVRRKMMTPYIQFKPLTSSTTYASPQSQCTSYKYLYMTLKNKMLHVTMREYSLI